MKKVVPPQPSMNTGPFSAVSAGASEKAVEGLLINKDQAALNKQVPAPYVVIPE